MIIRILEENFMNERLAKNINILGEFCGKRDIKELTPEELVRIIAYARLMSGFYLVEVSSMAEIFLHKR